MAIKTGASPLMRMRGRPSGLSGLYATSQVCLRLSVLISHTSLLKQSAECRSWSAFAEWRGARGDRACECSGS